MPVPPYIPAAPAEPRIAFVGEAPGAEEVTQGRPFVGSAGAELRKMCEEARIDLDACLQTNVFSERPSSFSNDVNQITVDAAGKAALLKELPDASPFATWPALSTGHYVRPDWLHHLERLRQEIYDFDPNLVIALGNTALWALCKSTGVGKSRGKVREGVLVPHKILPTYHPAGVLRQWKFRVNVVRDLQKARIEARTREITLPRRRVYVPESVEECLDLLGRLVGLTSTDIETAGRTITCIGFSSDPSWAVVVPLVDRRKPGYCYWSRDEEIRVLQEIRRLIMKPNVSLLFQNGAYDTQWLWRELGLPALGRWSRDTMLMHHARYLELDKDLNSLVSNYTRDADWKSIRKKAHLNDSDKRDE